MKNAPRKLSLNIETVRQLSNADLSRVAGGEITNTGTATSAVSPYYCLSWNTVCNCPSNYTC